MSNIRKAHRPQGQKRTIVTQSPVPSEDDELESFIDNLYEPDSEAVQPNRKIDLPKVYSEIADWKLEAKLEDNARYFFHVGEVQRIE